MNKYFITSTGTDIGKTYITCKMIQDLISNDCGVLALKPIISGWDINNPETDTIKILNSLQKEISEDNINLISPWRFKEPLSPDMAARSEGNEINFDELVAFCQKSESKTDNLLIEGVGGIMVPINNDKTILDLMIELNYPIILVAGSYLGTISHTLSAISCLVANNLNIDHIIVNQSIDGVDILETKKTIENFTNIPIKIIIRNN